MNKIIHYAIICLLLSVLRGQEFTKISDGEFVNDGGESFGVAWADLNNDGYADLYISNGGASTTDANNFLYINNGDGTFKKITEGDIVNGNQRSNGATIADYNNDGLPDIAVANRNGQNNFLYLNEGNLKFKMITDGTIVNDGGNSNANSWIDYNNDGRLDLFVTNFFETSFLYTNSADQTFEKISGVHPVLESNTSISAAWADYDNDGDQDLYVANAASTGKENLFYTNNGSGLFEKIVLGDLVKDKRASMGAAWGDYNNDGFLDLFVANQVNHTNDLYKNNGNGSFTAIRSGVVVSEKSYSISGSFIDIDNDADLDLFVSNWQYNKNFLYLNSGYPDYTFSKYENGNIVTDQENTMGAAWADYDNDGDLDLFIANRDGMNNSFYRNDLEGNNRIQFKLIGGQSNKSAIGTKIRIKAQINGTGIWQMREVNAQYGYNSQDEDRIHFGLAQANAIDTLIIEWPSGAIQHFENVSANRIYSLTEGGNLIELITSLEKQSSLNPEKFEIKQNYPNPFNPETTIEINVPAAHGLTGQSAPLKLEVFNLAGQKVATIFDGTKSSGYYQFHFDANGLASGLYIYTLTTTNKSISKKMLLIK